MSKQLFANEKVMTQYLGALLCEDEPEENLEPVGSIFIMILTGILVRLIVDWIVNNFIYNLKK